LTEEMRIGKYACELKWASGITDFLYNKLSDEDKKLGARSINRIVSSNIENKIIDFILEEQVITNNLIVSVFNGNIEIIKEESSNE